MKNKIIFFAISTLAIFTLGQKLSFAEEREMRLVREGYISVGASCPDIRQGKIIFRPNLREESIEVEVDNPEGYGYFRDKNGRPLPSFKVVVKEKDLEPLLIKLNTLSLPPSKGPSSRNASVEINLMLEGEKKQYRMPMAGGKKMVQYLPEPISINQKLSENNETTAKEPYFLNLEPLLKILDEFVQDLRYPEHKH